MSKPKQDAVALARQLAALLAAQEQPANEDDEEIDEELIRAKADRLIAGAIRPRKR